MASYSQTLSAVGRSIGIMIQKGDSFKYSADLSGDFDGVLLLQKRIGSGQAYQTIATVSADASNVLVENAEGEYSFLCKLGAEVTLTGTAAIILADVPTVIHEFKNRNGVSILTVTDDGIEVLGNISNVASGSQSAGLGTVGASTVVAAEYGSIVKKTVLTLTNVVVPQISVTTGNGVGGALVYTFPEGRINFLGLQAELSVSIAAGKQADFTDATPEGSLGIGTVAPANADALGTDATDDNFGTATAFVMSDYVDSSVSIPSEASAHFNGASTPIPMYVNMLTGSGDIDDGVTTEALVSGTITFHWINLGDL